MDIEFLYGMLNNLDDLEDKVDEIATTISVTRTTLKQMIEYLEEHFIDCDEEEEEEEDPEADIVVEFYNAIDD